MIWLFMRDQQPEQMRYDIAPSSFIVTLKALFPIAATISGGLFCEFCPYETEHTEQIHR